MKHIVVDLYHHWLYNPE